MEARYHMTTAAFQDRARLHQLPAISEFREWHEHIEALRRWKETREEYERLLGIMKISSS